MTPPAPTCVGVKRRGKSESASDDEAFRVRKQVSETYSSSELVPYDANVQQHAAKMTYREYRALRAEGKIEAGISVSRALELGQYLCAEIPNAKPSMAHGKD